MNVVDAHCAALESEIVDLRGWVARLQRDLGRSAEERGRAVDKQHAAEAEADDIRSKLEALREALR